MNIFITNNGSVCSDRVMNGRTNKANANKYN